MIFGFKIITGIPEDLAFKILGNTGMKLSRHTYNTPINNPVRAISKVQRRFETVAGHWNKRRIARPKHENQADTKPA